MGRHVNSDGQVMNIPFGENWGNACNSCLGWMKKKSTALKGKKEKWCCKTYALGVFIESKCGQSALQHNLESDEKDQEEVELDEANKVEAEWGWKPTWSQGKTLCGSYKNNEERHVNSEGQVMSIPFGENWGNACNSCLGWMKKKSTALKG